jgi:hypothetical protein
MINYESRGIIASEINNENPKIMIWDINSDGENNKLLDKNEIISLFEFPSSNLSINERLYNECSNLSELRKHKTQKNKKKKPHNKKKSKTKRRKKTYKKK